MERTSFATSQREPSQRDIEAGERQALLPRVTPSLFVRTLFFFSSSQIYLLLFVLFLIRLSLTSRIDEYAALCTEFLVADVLYVAAFFALLAVICIALSCMFMCFGCCGLCSITACIVAFTGCHYFLLKISGAHHLDVTCLAGEHCRTLTDGSPDLDGFPGFFMSWTWQPTGLLTSILGILWRPLWLDFYVLPAAIFGAGPVASGGVMWWQWREAFLGTGFWLTMWVFTTAAYTLQESPSLRLALGIGFMASIVACMFCFYLTVAPMVEFWSFLWQCWEHLFASKVSVVEGFAIALMLLWLGQCVYKIISMRLDEWNAKKAVQEGLQYAYDHPFRADLEENFGMLREEGSMVRTLSRLGSRSFLTAERINDLKEKQAQLHLAVQREERNSSMSTHLQRQLLMTIDRDNLLKESFDKLHNLPKSQLLAPHLMVQFQGEHGVDAGGLRRDWFESVSRALLDGAGDDSGDSLLALHEDQTLLPRPRGGKGKSDERDKQLWAVGVFLALALYHSQPLPLSFSLIACKFFCGRKVGMGDVQRLDPDFYRSRIEAVLKPGGLQELNEALGERLTWVSAPTRLQKEPEELIEEGRQLFVTDDNKQKYVEALCEAYLCAGIRIELQVLLNGFWHIMPLDCLRQAQVGPGDLSLMISGVQELDPKSWEDCTEVSDLGGTSVGQWFWEIVRDMSDQERCSLLHFVTGSSRLPPGGFPELDPQFKVTVTRGGEEERLPVSHTCVNQLVLQDYSSKEKLREKLLLAMQAEGFQFA
mmetsp:Transcript_16011/g.37758  ORF Transcript_16011/g.37758 Transcript_16011/m.37758 type:complete len:763 (-) Transcript_16011:205-2493(-)